MVQRPKTNKKTAAAKANLSKYVWSLADLSNRGDESQFDLLLLHLQINKQIASLCTNYKTHLNPYITKHCILHCRILQELRDAWMVIGPLHGMPSAFEMVFKTTKTGRWESNCRPRVSGVAHK